MAPVPRGRGRKPLFGADGEPQRLAGDFWGRRAGKTLRPRQRALVENLLPRLRPDLSKPAPADATALFARPVDDVFLEIGFGGGEHLIAEASRLPSTGFIGAEPFVNGVAKALAAIDGAGIDNLLIHDDDAARLLDWLPAATIGRIDLLYPDPWPKQRHRKRRFVNSGNVRRFARVLKSGGLFRFASDIDDYVAWTIAHVAADPAFAPTDPAADNRKPWPGWLTTRYEEKALREGRRPAYLTFVRA